MHPDVREILEDAEKRAESAERKTLEGVGFVDNADAHVLSVDVPPNTLGRSFSHTMETYGPSVFDDWNEGDPAEGEGNVSEAYLWVDRETDRPLRFAYRVRLGFEGDEEDDTVGSEMELLVDTRYTYDDEISIEEPDEISE